MAKKIVDGSSRLPQQPERTKKKSEDVQKNKIYEGENFSKVWQGYSKYHSSIPL